MRAIAMSDKWFDSIRYLSQNFQQKEEGFTQSVVKAKVEEGSSNTSVTSIAVSVPARAVSMSGAGLVSAGAGKDILTRSTATASSAMVEPAAKEQEVEKHVEIKVEKEADEAFEEREGGDQGAGAGAGEEMPREAGPKVADRSTEDVDTELPAAQRLRLGRKASSGSSWMDSKSSAIGWVQLCCGLQGA